MPGSTLRRRPSHIHNLRDVFLCPDQIANYQMAEMAVLMDSPADRSWFAQHKGRRVRFRQPSIRELLAAAAPPESSVKVTLQPDGVLVRELIPPGGKPLEGGPHNQ